MASLRFPLYQIVYYTGKKTFALGFWFIHGFPHPLYTDERNEFNYILPLSITVIQLGTRSECQVDSSWSFGSIFHSARGQKERRSPWPCVCVGVPICAFHVHNQINFPVCDTHRSCEMLGLFLRQRAQQEHRDPRLDCSRQCGRSPCHLSFGEG